MTRRVAAFGTWIVLAATTAAPTACGVDAPVPPPPLPGVAEGEEEWFWRDVLAAPLPGQAAVDHAALAHELPADRIDAIVAIERERAAPTLMAALRDEQIAVACVAAHRLGELGLVEAIPRLIAGVGPYPVDYDVPIHVRIAEASALARLGNPSGVPLLLDVLAEGTELERAEAELAWERTDRIAFMQELAVPGIIALSGTDFDFRPYPSPEPHRRQAVTRARIWWAEQRLALWAKATLDEPALAMRTAMLVAHLDAYQLRQVDGARFTLAELGPSVIPFLQVGLQSPSDYVRVHVLQVMERVVDRSDGKTRARLSNIATQPLLEDPVAGVAAQAAAVIGATGAPDPLIVALTRRHESEVLVSILDALGCSGRPEALDALAEFADAPEGGRRNADVAVALEAALLAADPDRPVDAFVALLSSEDRDTSFAALQRLVALTGSDWGVDPLAPPDARASSLSAARAALDERDRGCVSR